MARLLRVHKKISRKNPRYKRISYKNIVPVVALPGGCAIEVDKIGLPVASHIDHNGEQCVCRGHQAMLLLKYLHQWIRTDAVVFQIEIESAVRVIQGLVCRWNLGLSEDVIDAGFQDWLQGVNDLCSQQNPLFSGRIERIPWHLTARRLEYDG
jgi:hypothetical protein